MLELEEAVVMLALGELKEKNKKKSRRRSWVHPITCDMQKKQKLYFGLIFKF
jgi:hypothetical protein